MRHVTESNTLTKYDQSHAIQWVVDSNGYHLSPNMIALLYTGTIGLCKCLEDGLYVVNLIYALVFLRCFPLYFPASFGDEGATESVSGSISVGDNGCWVKVDENTSQGASLDGPHESLPETVIPSNRDFNSTACCKLMYQNCFASGTTYGRQSGSHILQMVYNKIQ